MLDEFDAFRMLFLPKLDVPIVAGCDDEIGPTKATLPYAKQQNAKYKTNIVAVTCVMTSRCMNDFSYCIAKGIERR